MPRKDVRLMSFFWLPVKQELTTEQWSDGAAQALEEKGEDVGFVERGNVPL